MAPDAWSTCSNEDFKEWYRKEGHTCLRIGVSASRPEPSRTSTCYTTSGSECIFPFKAWGAQRTTCTTVDGDEPWCATQTDAEGDLTDWDYCPASCPTDQGFTLFKRAPQFGKLG